MINRGTRRDLREETYSVRWRPTQQGNARRGGALTDGEGGGDLREETDGVRWRPARQGNARCGGTLPGGEGGNVQTTRFGPGATALFAQRSGASDIGGRDRALNACAR
jgi:hypothetical protein